MKKFKHALIMAAGRGVRMMPLTMVVPKAMVPFQGATIIADGIRRIEQHIENIYITVGYKGAMLAEHVIGEGVNAIFNTSNKGNAWWIYNTPMKYLNEPTVVLTCDNVIELDFELLFQEYCNYNNPACMIVPVKPVPGLEGDYVFHENHVVTKLDRHQPSDSYCSGIQIVNPFKINKLTNNTEDFCEVWNQLIKQKEVYASKVYPESWYAIDTIAHLDQINKTGIGKTQI